MHQSLLVAIGLLLLSAPRAAFAQSQTSPVLQAMRTELKRSFESLRSQPTPSYFLSYEVTEVDSIAIVGSFGAVTSSEEGRHRLLDLDLRVGNYRLDNSHNTSGPSFSLIALPLGDEPLAIRSQLWFATDRRYKAAVEQLARAHASQEVQVTGNDNSPDFSPEPPQTYNEPLVKAFANRRDWEAKIRKYTAPFARYGSIFGGMAALIAEAETRWYVNTEGTELQISHPTYRLWISASSKADDGMELPRYESFFAATPEGLPSDATVLAAVDKMIADLQALRAAPVADPYTGPAILSGRASAVFFHEIFGHRLEGHRLKQVEEGQTLKKMVNQSILPQSFSVYSDPTLKQLGKVDLMGFYPYDNQGVKARRVTVVENGVLKSFLMSRSPIEGFPESNGHGRKQTGFGPVARQSNLIVQDAQPKTRAQLKQMLIDQVRRDGKPFGLYFDDIEGGFTITGRIIPNAFTVLPTMVYRVYPDGREELVRGLDLIGTPLATFSRIVASDDGLKVFNGMCGAESGWVPVSAIAPGVLITQIEVQKKPQSQERAPILPAPLPAVNRGVSLQGNR